MKRIISARSGIFAIVLGIIAAAAFGLYFIIADTQAFGNSSGNAISDLSGMSRVSAYASDAEDENLTYSNSEIIDYFCDVVFSSELDGYVGYACKWTSPIKYRIYGERSDEDIALFGELVEYLNGVEGFPGMSEAETPDEANFEIYYTTEAAMPGLFNNYIEGSWGMATFWWQKDTHEIVKARSAIVCDVTDQYAKNTVMLEEITQAMGLGNDSLVYPDSLYYQNWSQPQKMPYIDRCIFELLYNPGVPVGATEETAREILYAILDGE